MKEPRGPCGVFDDCILRGGHPGICRDILNEPLPQVRKGIKFVPLPDGAGELRSATVFNGMLFIACDGGVYVRRHSGVWQTVDVV